MESIDYEHQVTLTGMSGSTQNQPIYVLPHGCHPESEMYFKQESNIGPVTVTIMGDGSVLVDAETEWVKLDGISFIAAHV
jgi:hypothetical protein